MRKKVGAHSQRQPSPEEKLCSPATAIDETTSLTLTDRVHSQYCTLVLAAPQQDSVSTAPHFISFLTPSIVPDHRDLGIAVFFQQHTQSRPLQEYSDPNPMFLDFASTIFRTSNNQMISACIKAVGLASLANIRSEKQILTQARKEYVESLRLVNNALRVPSEAVQDSTLLGVMLLNFFEQITCVDGHFVHIWTQHVNGAALLVKLRGTHQFTYKVGLQMFQHICQSLTTNCIQTGLPVPQHIIELRKQCAQYIDSESPIWLIGDTMIKLTLLRSRVASGSNNDDDMDQILQDALDLDLEFKTITTRLSAEMPYHTCVDPSEPQFYKGTYHIYPTVWTLYAWNSLRSGRCLLHQLIRSQMLKGFSAIPPRFLSPDYTSIFQESLENLLQMINDILCSAAQLIGWIPTPNLTPEKDPITAGARLLIWPFYVVIHICTSMGLFATIPGIDKYMMNVLAEVGRQTGILAATLLSSLLADRNLLQFLPKLKQKGFRMVEG